MWSLSCLLVIAVWTEQTYLLKKEFIFLFVFFCNFTFGKRQCYWVRPKIKLIYKSLSTAKVRCEMPIRSHCFASSNQELSSSCRLCACLIEKFWPKVQPGRIYYLLGISIAERKGVTFFDNSTDVMRNCRNFFYYIRSINRNDLHWQEGYDKSETKFSWGVLNVQQFLFQWTLW